MYKYVIPLLFAALVYASHKAAPAALKPQAADYHAAFAQPQPNQGKFKL